MIVIIGSRFDDIAYITKKMIVSRVDELTKQCQVFVGKYAGKEVAVSVTGYGQEMSTLVTGAMIRAYEPYLVVNVGSVGSIHPSMKQGDLFLATRIYAMDVDLLALGQYAYGQIPEQPEFFASAYDQIKQIVNLNILHQNKNIVQGVLLSSNKFYTSLDEIEETIKYHFIRVRNIVATDTESSGMATACSLYDVPFLCFKVCSYEVGIQEQLLNRVRTGVINSSAIGQLLTKLFRELDKVIE